VGYDTITIRHSVPVRDVDPEPTGGPRQLPVSSQERSGPCYLLRSGASGRPERDWRSARASQSRDHEDLHQGRPRCVATASSMAVANIFLAPSRNTVVNTSNGACQQL
jgi:hypothetical protein